VINTLPEYHLYFFLIGCRPSGRNIEQHDVFFTIASSLIQAVSDINNFWPEAKDKIHIDAWRIITETDGYSIDVIHKNKSNASGQSEKLFFINLGGYKPDEFEEFHYKLLIVSENKSAAINKAKQTAFYKHTGFKGAESHIDDKFGIDVDDIYQVDDILPKSVKEFFSIKIVHDNRKKDILNIGYLPLHKIK
jgi:hypothetical protein